MAEPPGTVAAPKQAWMEAFADAQADMPPLHKGRTVTVTTQAGGSYSYAYADLPTILEIVQPVLQKHGLALAQAVVSEDGRVGVETRIYHKAGHVEVFGPLLLTAGNNAQAAGSAVTYARRYSLCAALGIAADEDDDGASAVRQTVTDTQPNPQDFGAWLANAVQSLSKWDAEARKQAYKAVMEDLGLDSMSSMKEAKKIFEGMHQAYLIEHPPADDEAVF